MSILCPQCHEHARTPGKPLCWNCIDERLHREPPDRLTQRIGFRNHHEEGFRSDTSAIMGFTTRFKEYPE